ncbi:MAG: hypothetical protein NT049_09080, partial [Planctomycetota bacterium]|nr:hypothetical protein [Planctomycetota bacterium]
MPRLAYFGISCLALVLIAGAVSFAADAPADNPPAVKAAAPEKGEARPESSVATPPPERVPGRMPGEGAPRIMRSGDPDALRAALAEFGPTKILYRVDQPVNVFQENIMVGSSEPMVTSSRKTDTGQTVNTVSYNNVGLIISIAAGQPPKDSDRKGLDVRMQIEVASIGESGVELTPKVKSAVIRKVSISHSAGLQYARPLVMLNVTYPQKDEKASA